MAWYRSLKIRGIDKKFLDIAWGRLNNLTKPRGSLGMLEKIAARLVAIYEDPFPVIKKKVSFVFAADHGITEEGVSAFPKEVTAQMVFNFLRGGAGINVLARHANSEVVVVDVGVDYNFGVLEGLVMQKVVYGTKNFAKEPAMSREEAEKCLLVGYNLAREYLDKGYNLVGIGDMGIGNTTASSAITSAITGVEVEKVVGPGTGIDGERLKRKIKVIQKAIELHQPNPEDPLDVLAKVGGAEIGACAGVILACAEKRVPVLLDGFITTAGALLAYKINPLTREFMFASHQSEEPGHQIQLSYLQLKPILNLGLRLGEGTGAALAMTVLEASLKIYREMATFEEASVSRENKSQ